MKQIAGFLVVALVAGSAVQAAASDERWIHVRVAESDGARGRVDIQVPVGLVTSLLPALKSRNAKHSIHIDGKDLDLVELRGYWEAVRAAKDGESITVRDRDSDVRVSKRGGELRLIVDERGGGSRVRMTIPILLVDAVLSGKDSIDLDALGAALAKAPMGELLTVDDDDSHVRLWIDARASPVREDGR